MLEHHVLPLRVLVGLRVGEEALAGLLAEAPLRDEPLEDQRRREVLAPLPLGWLERLEGVVEAAVVGALERPGHDPGARHHPEVDVADPRDALLEHEARLDERLEAEALDERVESAARLSLSAHRTPSRSSGRGRP